LRSSGCVRSRPRTRPLVDLRPRASHRLPADLDNTATFPWLASAPGRRSRGDEDRRRRHGEAATWTAMGASRRFLWRGQLVVRGGGINLSSTAAANETATASVERFGVGEVFVVAGHSVRMAAASISRRHGRSRQHRGASLRRQEMRRHYRFTGLAGIAPALVAHHFRLERAARPAGTGTYFWAPSPSRSQNRKTSDCSSTPPSAGTSLEHWASPPARTFRASLRLIRPPIVPTSGCATRSPATARHRSGAILSDQDKTIARADASKIVANYIA
jgi:hypothetical protein